jgi:hypothetical protein
VTIIAVNIFLAIAFVSTGDLHMPKQPSLPDPDLPLSLASDLSYMRAAVLENEAGMTEGQPAGFTTLVDAAETPETIDDLAMIASQLLAAVDNANHRVRAAHVSFSRSPSLDRSCFDCGRGAARTSRIVRAPHSLAGRQDAG